jgi:hypothetical protein
LDPKKARRREVVEIRARSIASMSEERGRTPPPDSGLKRGFRRVKDYRKLGSQIWTCLAANTSGILWLGAGGIWLSAFTMVFLPVEMRNRQMF